MYGGVSFDEISKQSDINFENNGSLLETTCFTSLGHEGHICNKLRNGNCVKAIGTQANRTYMFR